MKAKDQSRFGVDALRDLAGKAVFARGEAYQELRPARQPVCGRGRQSRVCGAAKLMARMAALQSTAEQAAYVAALKVRHGQKRNWVETMRRAKIEQQNQYLLDQQRRFRVAADIVADAWMAFPEVHAVAVIGSVAKALWKEVPRFIDFRREGIEVWHECRDLDLALWIESQQRLREIHRAANHALSKAFTSGAETGVVAHQLDIFMFDPANDAYLGRLCSFSQCPKGKRDCLVPGCGAIAFNKVVDGFVPRADLLTPPQHATFYRRGVGRLRSALDLPGVELDPEMARHRKSSEMS